MSTETLYQQGSCPNCSIEAQQRLLFATNDCAGPFFESGKIVGYMRVRTLSLFRCEGCQSTLVYETALEDRDDPPLSYEVAELPSPEWVLDLSRPEFRGLSTLFYATPRLDYVRIIEDLGLSYALLPETSKELFFSEKSILDPSTPKAVRGCYEIGVRVRPFSTDLYALQLRKTLEAVCKDLGASERLSSGKRAMLWQQIDELKNQNLVGEFISKAAHELKDISNTGAHYSDREVTQGDIRKLEHLLALITTYVYGGKKMDSAESPYEIEDIG